MNTSVITREQLEQSGFKPVKYEGQEGIFMAKTLKSNDMPYFMEHVVDGEYVFDTDDVVVEVGPDNRVQLVDLNTDYFEESVPVDSDEGRTLLIDAGFVFKYAEEK